MGRSELLITLILLGFWICPAETRRLNRRKQAYCYNEDRKPFHFNHMDFECWWRLVTVGIISAICAATLVSMMVGITACINCPLCYDQLIEEEYPF
ncbi:unnamed protein product [Bursaphelenchus xylophilus]|uniref:(pine wood nematode) hypothetical protein n=1 Tax=Bursaphelenchus xylophilus TaxID=6326 RepID=A0A1I7SC36_BURXY|nr:unnamed protein product [Bursaphelenchus xylophilus]CAG9086477.1 unnamed protein product [Bursaphelenchus xylophilus]